MVKKLMPGEVKANSERETARLQAWRNEDANSGTFRSFQWAQPRREVIEAVVAAGYEFKVKSGKLYRAQHTADGLPRTRVTAIGKEEISAVMLRNGRQFGPVRWVDFANTSLAE